MKRDLPVHFFLSCNLKIFTSTNVNNCVASSKPSRCTILKVYQSWFNIRCIKYTRKFCFYFCVYSLVIFSHMISTLSTYFQNHPTTKHLYGHFCPVFVGNLSFSSGILPCREGIKNVPASHKQNIALETAMRLTSCLSSRPVFYFVLLLI